MFAIEGCTIPPDIFSRRNRKKFSVFLRVTVHHLFLELGAKQQFSVLEVILDACPHVTNIFFLDDTILEYLPLLDRLECLRRLTIDVSTLFAPGAIDFATYNPPPGMIEGLALMLHLTHIDFNLPSDIAALHARIQPNTQLRCIVFLTFMPPSDPLPNPDDIRVLCIAQTDFRRDWYRGATNGRDFWALADIATKQARKVDHTHYCLSESYGPPSNHTFPGSLYYISEMHQSWFL
ncbi:hypothetical protein DFH08DRAFT_973834 [Mycena albidolilacea]|uniref:Uncharacterized protein n=1 Tax=Mycena albidolilacea TaxID=1033008 RepID=A0AAD6Z8C7_9AGAR|nr:hypothetical protein DFH08DRAFT_973834 [Mycena albidolilacea]